MPRGYLGELFDTEKPKAESIEWNDYEYAYCYICFFSLRVLNSKLQRGSDVRTYIERHVREDLRS